MVSSVREYSNLDNNDNLVKIPNEETSLDDADISRHLQEADE